MSCRMRSISLIGPRPETPGCSCQQLSSRVAEGGGNRRQQRLWLPDQALGGDDAGFVLAGLPEGKSLAIARLPDEGGRAGARFSGGARGAGPVVNERKKPGCRACLGPMVEHQDAETVESVERGIAGRQRTRRARVIAGPSERAGHVLR